MNIQKIKYFIDLVECKNFTETAKKIMFPRRPSVNP